MRRPIAASASAAGIRIATISIFAKTTCLFSAGSGTAYPPLAMALFSRSTRLPQCSSCIRRITQQNVDAWGTQQTRSISKRAKEAERNIVVKLLKDVPRYGRAGMSSYAIFGALLTIRRLLRAIEPLAHAQPMVPSPCRRLRARRPAQAAQSTGPRSVERLHFWCPRHARGSRGGRGGGRIHTTCATNRNRRTECMCSPAASLNKTDMTSLNDPRSSLIRSSPTPSTFTGNASNRKASQGNMLAPRAQLMSSLLLPWRAGQKHPSMPSMALYRQPKLCKL